MFVATSHGIEKSGTGLEKFGKTLSAEGSFNEPGQPISDNIAVCPSIIKPGAAQLARQGHCIKRLESRIAFYINQIDASWVKESHPPLGEPAEKNEKLPSSFREAFTGESAEGPLWFRADGNCYGVQ